MKELVPSFNIATVEGKMLNYCVQSQEADRIYREKCDTKTIKINVTELGKQAVKEYGNEWFKSRTEDPGENDKET